MMKNLILTRLTVPELRRVIRQELILALSEHAKNDRIPAMITELRIVLSDTHEDGTCCVHIYDSQHYENNSEGKADTVFHPLLSELPEGIKPGDELVLIKKP